MVTNINLGIKEFDKLTYSQKENYLIDCKGYSESDFEGLGELGINCIFENEEILISECIEFNK